MKINPCGQIPALIFKNGQCLKETLALMMYLADSENVIIVTAQKSEQALREVPISVSTIYGDDFD